MVKFRVQDLGLRYDDENLYLGWRDIRTFFLDILYNSCIPFGCVHRSRDETPYFYASPRRRTHIEVFPEPIRVRTRVRVRAHIEVFPEPIRVRTRVRVRAHIEVFPEPILS